MRLVVLGGSGASTPELFDAIEQWPGGEVRRPPLEVILSGRSHDKLELVATAARARTGSRADVAVSTATDRRAALEGADVVINQVRVGGLDAREFDETFPRRHGLPGEETMGAGGFANALRTVPALRAIWADVAAVAPDALVINLTNPAGVVVQAAQREFGLNIVEVCDSPISLCEAVAARRGTGPLFERTRYVGLNHVGWWVPETPGGLESVSDLATGVSPDTVEVLASLPGPYLRYYVAPNRMAAEQRDTAPRAAVLRALETTMLKAYAAGDPAGGPRRGAGWYSLAIVPVLDAWQNGSDESLIVGRAVDEVQPLNGDRRLSATDHLPSGSVVESAWLVRDRTFVMAGQPPELPPLPRSILELHAQYERLTVDAVLGGAPRTALVRALAANPMVRDVDLASALVDEILASSP